MTAAPAPAHKISIAPMMDWTDIPFLSGILLLVAGLRRNTCAKRV